MGFSEPGPNRIAAAVFRIADAERILELHPFVRLLCVLHLERARIAGVPFILPECYRSIERQNELYAIGRDAAGVKIGRTVTNAQGGQSWHQFRLAYDVALLKPDGTHVHWDEQVDNDKDGIADWLEVVRIGEATGLAAGYRWPTGKHDGAHFEFHPALTLSEVRKTATVGWIDDNYFGIVEGT